MKTGLWALLDALNPPPATHPPTPSPPPSVFQFFFLRFVLALPPFSKDTLTWVRCTLSGDVCVCVFVGGVGGVCLSVSVCAAAGRRPANPPTPPPHPPTGGEGGGEGRGENKKGSLRTGGVVVVVEDFFWRTVVLCLFVCLHFFVVITCVLCECLSFSAPYPPFLPLFFLFPCSHVCSFCHCDVPKRKLAVVAEGKW